MNEKGISFFRSLLKSSSVGPALRRFFVNTLFDSTFMSLGIIVGSGLSERADIEVILATMVTTSLALGISTGVSVYEAESLERGRRIAELETAMLTDLGDSTISRSARSATFVIAFVNFCTPLAACTLTIMPFLMVRAGWLEIVPAAWLAAGIALTVLFIAGWWLGRMARTSPWSKGLRMLGFGLLAFSIGYWIDLMI